MLDSEIVINEVQNVINILKPNKSPGEDSIISEFYVIFLGYH